jgi:hypothetical protein
MQTTDPSLPQNILRELRSLIPADVPTLAEALLAAERQASLILDRLGDHPATIPAVLGLFRHITVRYDISPTHVFSYWNGSTWIITVHGRLTADDRRFHVLQQLAAIIWDERVNAEPHERLAWLVHIVEHFAYNLLAPAQQVDRLWASGIRDIDSLGLHFGASHHVIITRLMQLRPWQTTTQTRPQTWSDYVDRYPTHAESITRWLSGELYTRGAR